MHPEAEPRGISEIKYIRMNYISIAFLFFSVILSGLSVLLFKIGEKKLKLILSFSGAYLFAISVLHLIPELYAHENNTIGIYILIGFILQIFLEFFSEGIEHGHIHAHQHSNKFFPFMMMLGLSIHSFIEGMPLFGSMLNNQSSAQNPLLTGILLHNIPIAIALMSMLLQSHIKKLTAFVMLMVFATITPLGMLTGYFIETNSEGSVALYSNKIMGIVIGIFLHISTTILFESNENHRFNFLKLLIILLGAGIAVATM